MRVRAEQFCAFRTDSVVAKRCARGRTADDSDVLGHCDRIPLLIEIDDIAICDCLRTGESRISPVGRKAGVPIGFEILMAARHRSGSISLPRTAR